MAYQTVSCQPCNGSNVVRYGTQSSRSRFRCKDCCRIFKADYVYRAYEPGVKEQIVDVAVNGSGIRDTHVSRVLVTIPSFRRQKYSAEVTHVSPHFAKRAIAVEIRHLIDSPIHVQADEQWSYVGNNNNQRWLWYAIGTATGCVLSFILSRRQDSVFKKLYDNLQAFNIKRYYTDDGGRYSKYIPQEKHVIGKVNTQKIENKNLGLRARVRGLARKTICFSKSERLHDTVIGLFVSRYCFHAV